MKCEVIRWAAPRTGNRSQGTAPVYSRPCVNSVLYYNQAWIYNMFVSIARDSRQTSHVASVEAHRVQIMMACCTDDRSTAQRQARCMRTEIPATGTTRCRNFARQYGHNHTLRAHPDTGAMIGVFGAIPMVVCYADRVTFTVLVNAIDLALHNTGGTGIHAVLQRKEKRPDTRCSRPTPDISHG